MPGDKAEDNEGGAGWTGGSTGENNPRLKELDAPWGPGSRVIQPWRDTPGTMSWCPLFLAFLQHMPSGQEKTNKKRFLQGNLPGYRRGASFLRPWRPKDLLLVPHL